MRKYRNNKCQIYIHTYLQHNIHIFYYLMVDIFDGEKFSLFRKLEIPVLTLHLFCQLVSLALFCEKGGEGVSSSFNL